LTAVFEKTPNGYIEYAEELPGANTRGITLEETKKSFKRNSVNFKIKSANYGRRNSCRRKQSKNY
jgi:hypothetical protein